MTTVTASKPTVRRKLKKLEVMVAEVIRETPDTVTLVLFTGNESLDYRPGHFLTIDPHQFAVLDRFTRYLEEEKGRKEPPRAYSMASAPHEGFLSITVKEEPYIPGITPYPPLLSPLLVQQTPPGTRMTVTGFTGPFTLPEDIAEKTGHLVHVAAGSGVVPNFSMIKYALAHHPELRQTLVFSSKTWEDVIYKADLAELEAAHPERLQVFHALTRETDTALFGDRVRKGRVDEALLREVIDSPEAVEVFVCGPGISAAERKAAKATGREASPRFMESVLAMLGAVGVPGERIHRESYG
jgi:ferredoxin-NADP reductase